MSRELELALIKAIKEAKIHRHEYVTVEHMLYGLLHDELARHIISQCGGNNDNLKERLERFFDGGMPVTKEGGSDEPAQTVAFNRVLQRAVNHVQSCGKKQVDTGDVLVAILNEQDSHAVYFLGTEGVGRLEVMEYISHSLPEYMKTTHHKQNHPADTCNILRGLQSRYEEHHQIRYAKTAITATAELAQRYINDRFLPDKAIDIMDEVGASFRLAGKKDKVVMVRDVEEIVAKMARVPVTSKSNNDTADLLLLEGKLQAHIFGQDEAISTLVKAVKRSRAGLGNPQSPTGSFLFAGPTGVGKTEVARQLAISLGVNFERFDMSEYMEKHAVARLIGAPPGYVGFDQGGLLTDAIRKHPYTVLLLDEIEKAHPDVFSILLQVMDHSTLTDNSGRRADFRNVILIMTTNAGAREMSERSIGFIGDSSGKEKKAITNLFSPEFRNRLDATISFSNLNEETVEKVVEKLVNELQGQLAEKKVHIQLSKAARKWLAQKGYEPAFGARPLRRFIMKEIGDVLTEEILFGALSKGGTAIVDHKKGAMVFTYK